MRQYGHHPDCRATSLPSVGSRRARFPVFIGTTKALRLPARANLLPYGFGCRPHAPLLCSCIVEALLTDLAIDGLTQGTSTAIYVWTGMPDGRTGGPAMTCSE
jgi:hypothetical protein